MFFKKMAKMKKQCKDALNMKFIKGDMRNECLDIVSKNTEHVRDKIEQ